VPERADDKKTPFYSLCYYLPAILSFRFFLFPFELERRSFLVYFDAPLWRGSRFQEITPEFKE
jgi:hypothetical protein